MAEFILHNKSVKAKSITAVLAVISAIALPQVFHVVGAVSGLGSALGASFLPMHLPVLLAAFLAGPVVGVFAGLISPIISFLLSGMPASTILPFMALELATYGLVGGLLRNTKMPVFAKLVLVQLAGRAVRAIAVLLAVYAFGGSDALLSQLPEMVLVALPGILLQWALIPLLVYRMEGLKKYYE